MKEGHLLCQETPQETGMDKGRSPTIPIRDDYDTHHHLICRGAFCVSIGWDPWVIRLTSSSNPYFVSGASFPQAVGRVFRVEFYVTRDMERNIHPSNLISSPLCFWIASSTAINLAFGYAFLNSPEGHSVSGTPCVIRFSGYLSTNGVLGRVRR